MCGGRHRSRQGDRPPDYIAEITDLFHAALLRFTGMGKPMVTAINGPAAGPGIGLALIAAMGRRRAPIKRGGGRTP